MSTTFPHTDVAVIGAGFSGLAAAATLARSGKRVTVFERHDMAGGRARTFSAEGFVFDMGPSWYWMPDVFEQFFRSLGREVADHLDLVRLDPSYRVWFPSGPVDVPAGAAAVRALFERLEPGSGPAFDRFMEEARKKYELGMNDFVWRTGDHPFEYVGMKAIRSLLSLSMFGSLSRHIRKHFKDDRIRQLLEFPVLFLGSRPEHAPALYSLMNYADTVLGTWYPMGGMHRVVAAMTDIAEAEGAVFRYGCEVTEIAAAEGRVAGVRVDGAFVPCEAVIAAADYHHVEQHLLTPEWRRYGPDYWKRRKLSPGSLIFYLGLDRRVPELLHHTLFFDVPFEDHASKIYDTPDWPEDPQFYVAAPSRTDPSVAPPGCENVFILIPLASGLAPREGAHEVLFQKVMDRIERATGRDLRPHVVFRRDYAHADFEADYHAYLGNAYGLANTIDQTAFLKPKMRSLLPGLFFAGQLTNPGPGVPPSLISGRIAARETEQWLASLPQHNLPTP